ncbi:MAG: hypothetical protein ABSC20_00025 [Candidatus Bathyarchaeia archaeon]|jgi:hypothetical protein
MNGEISVQIKDRKYQSIDKRSNQEVVYFAEIEQKSGQIRERLQCVFLPLKCAWDIPQSLIEG